MGTSVKWVWAPVLKWVWAPVLSTSVKVGMGTSVMFSYSFTREVLTEARLVSEVFKAQLGGGEKTHPPPLTSWRRKKGGHRRTKIEKQLLDPLPSNHGGIGLDGVDSDDIDGDGDGGHGDGDDGGHGDDDGGHGDGGHGGHGDDDGDGLASPSKCAAGKTEMVGGALSPSPLVTVDPVQGSAQTSNTPGHPDTVHQGNCKVADHPTEAGVPRPPNHTTEAQVPRPPGHTTVTRQPATYVQLQRNPDIQVR